MELRNVTGRKIFHRNDDKVIRDLQRFVCEKEREGEKEFIAHKAVEVLLDSFKTRK